MTKNTTTYGNKKKNSIVKKVAAVMLSAVILFAGFNALILYSGNTISAQAFTEEDIQKLAAKEVNKAEEGLQEYVKNYITEENITNFYTEADVDIIKQIAEQAVEDGLDNANAVLSENQKVEVDTIIDERVSETITLIENEVPGIVSELSLSDSQREEVERMIAEAIAATTPSVTAESSSPMSEDEKNALRESILADCKALMEGYTFNTSEGSFTLTEEDKIAIAEIVKNNLNLQDEINKAVANITIDEESIINKVTENVSAQITNNIFNLLTEEDIDIIKQKVIDAVSTDISEIQTQIADLQVQTSNINQQITGINGEIENLKEQIEAANTGDIADLKVKLEAAEGKLASLENSLNSLSLQKDEIIASVATEASERAAADEALDERLVVVEGKAADLGNEITSVYTEIEELKDQIATANEDEIADLQARMQAAEEKLAEHESSLQTLISEKDAIKQSITDEATARSNADSSLNTRLTNLEKTVNSLSTKIGTVQTAVNDEATTRANADANLQTQIDALNTDLTNDRNRLSTLESKVGIDHFGYGTKVFILDYSTSKFVVDIPEIKDLSYVILASNGDSSTQNFTVKGTTIKESGKVEIETTTPAIAGYTRINYIYFKP